MPWNISNRRNASPSILAPEKDIAYSTYSKRLRKLAAKNCPIRLHRDVLAILASSMPTPRWPSRLWVGPQSVHSMLCAPIAGAGKAATQMAFAINDLHGTDHDFCH